VQALDRSGRLLGTSRAVTASGSTARRATHSG
jgi:hypothetical protein